MSRKPEGLIHDSRRSTYVGTDAPALFAGDNRMFRALLPKPVFFYSSTIEPGFSRSWIVKSTLMLTEGMGVIWYFERKVGSSLVGVLD